MKCSTVDPASQPVSCYYFGMKRQNVKTWKGKKSLSSKVFNYVHDVKNNVSGASLPRLPLIRLLIIFDDMEKIRETLHYS